MKLRSSVGCVAWRGVNRTGTLYSAERRTPEGTALGPHHRHTTTWATHAMHCRSCFPTATNDEAVRCHAL